MEEKTKENFKSLLATLTPLQRKFVLAYIETLNATESAARAGYKGKRSTLAVVGSQNIRKLNIRTTIDAGLEAYGKISANELLTRLSRIAEGDLSGYLDYKEITRSAGNGKTYQVEVMWFDLERFKADGLGFLIKKVKNLSNGGVDVEFHDPVKALELMGKHYAAFTERLDLEGELTTQWVYDL